jgi:DNA-binding FrmR family transcriptional regulator
MNGQEHQSHPEIVKRVRRIEGQVRSIVAMIESERSCLDIAQQFAAVTNALTSAKNVFIRDHIDHCLIGAAGSTGNEELNELKAMTKYL